MSSETVEVTFRGVPMTLDCDYFPACRGARERGSGVQLEPDSPAEVVVNNAHVKGIEVWSLVEDDEEELAELALAVLGEEPDGDY